MFRNHLAEYIMTLNYFPCKADPDVWMRSAKKSDGTEYYEYVFLYVADCLAISEHPKLSILQIDNFFKMQEKSIGPPDIFWVVRLVKFAFRIWWRHRLYSSSRYVKEAVLGCARLLRRMARLPLSHTDLNYKVYASTIF